MIKTRNLPSKKNQCYVSGMFIPDPGSEFFHPESSVKKNSGSRSASKNLRISSSENGFQALGNIIQDVHPRIRILIFYPSRIPGLKSTGSQIRNTGKNSLNFNIVLLRSVVYVPSPPLFSRRGSLCLNCLSVDGVGSCSLRD
jgi:hypothetical protein